jgi:uncharacterized protein (TIGR02246 family)
MMRLPMDLQEDVREIARIRCRIEAAENAGDATAVVDMLADDAVIMAPNQLVQEGKPACAAFLADVIPGLQAEFDRHIEYVSAEVRVIGDFGFDRGGFSFTAAPRSGGARSRETGKYLFLYSRALDGSWKIARAIVNLDDAGEPVDAAKVNELAARYTAAWCSHDAASVASFYAEHGSLTINEGAPSVGRVAIAAAAQAFMTDFPDMIVTMDGVGFEGDHIRYRWTLIGTNTGPGGTGKSVRISGYEEWRIGSDGRIAESRGHFEEAEYRRQLQAGAAPGR